jgi:hypothetical protein
MRRETITLAEAIRRAEATVARHTARTHPCDRAFDERHLEWLKATNVATRTKDA